jgi:putative transposase
MKRSQLYGRADHCVLRKQEAGVRIAEVCRKHGVSAATFYIYGRLPPCKLLEGCF